MWVMVNTMIVIMVLLVVKKACAVGYKAESSRVGFYPHDQIR